MPNSAERTPFFFDSCRDIFDQLRAAIDKIEQRNRVDCMGGLADSNDVHLYSQLTQADWDRLTQQAEQCRRLKSLCRAYFNLMLKSTDKENVGDWTKVLRQDLELRILELCEN